MITELFLACWLEYHSDIPAARAFVRRVFAARDQAAREFGIRFRKRWYSKQDRLHEISTRESPFLARMRAQQAPCEVVAHALVPYP